jgi:hypothetical protein
MKQSLSILTLLLSCFYANAQVVVNQTPIPQKIASYYNLINVNLINTSGASIEGASMRYEVFHGRSSASELIAKGASASFTISHTGLSINSANYQALLGPLKEEKRPKQAFLDYIVQTGNVPPGKVKVCVTILSKDQKVLGTSCQESNVLQTTSLFLIAPSNKSKLSSQWPTFSWSSTSMGGGATYEVVITQIIGNQSGQQAIQQNPVFYTQKVNANLLQYNMGSQPFKNEGRYVWYIRQLIGKEEIAKSELWEFTYSELKKPTGDSPVKVKTHAGINTQEGGNIIVKDPVGDDCLQLSVSDGGTVREYNVKSDKRPIFKWSTNTHKALSYEFELYELTEKVKSFENVKPIYQTKTQGRSLGWPPELRWPKSMKEGDSRYYVWKVAIAEGQGDVCNGVASGQMKMYVSGSDIDADSIIMECLNPEAFDTLGNVCYIVTEYWSIINNSSSQVYNFTSHTNSAGLTIIPSPGSHFPTSVAANSGATVLVPFTYTICLPLSTTIYTSELEYTASQTSNTINGVLELSVDSFPNCVCEPCLDWEIDIDNKQVTPRVNLKATQDYVFIVDELNVTSPFGPIVRVDAEIIDYNYKSKEPCTTCNKLDGQHGTFVPYYDASNNPIANELSTGFKTNDLAKYQVANPGSAPPPSREIFWEAVAPSGVTMPLTAKLTVGVPNFSPLIDCCADYIQFCIRYTITSYSEKYGCRKCSKVVCYEVKRNKDSIKIKDEEQHSY